MLYICIKLFFISKHFSKHAEFFFTLSMECPKANVGPFARKEPVLLDIYQLR